MPLELLAPPLVATLLPLALSVASSLIGKGGSERLLREAGDWGVTLFWAYLFGIIPSAVYMLAMERAFARGLSPGSGKTVVRSAGLGLAAGVAIGGGLSLLFGPNPEVLLLLAGDGLATGAVLGWLIRRFSPRTSHPA
jgi:hypothetical protein